MLPVKIYKIGLCYASVCADSEMSGEEVADEVNKLSPTGISSRWQISDEKEFSDKTPAPSPCNEDNNRIHWLLEC
jgi:hypothetical protein